MYPDEIFNWRDKNPFWYDFAKRQEELSQHQVPTRHKPARRGWAEAHLGVFEQDWGVEAGVGLRDVQSPVVGNFFLPRADVRWRSRPHRLGCEHYAYVQQMNDKLQINCGRQDSCFFWWWWWFKSNSVFSLLNVPWIKSSPSGMSGNSLWNVLLCLTKLWTQERVHVIACALCYGNAWESCVTTQMTSYPLAFFPF